MPFQFRKEAIEEDLNSNFPSQGQGNPPLYYSLSEVVVPTYSINDVAEGTSLPETLQQAWDFSTGHNTESSAGSTNIITTPGFWLIQLNTDGTGFGSGSDRFATISMTDGVSTKNIIRQPIQPDNPNNLASNNYFQTFVVFVRSGDTVTHSATAGVLTVASYRQIATVNGELVNPLGFSFA